MFVLHLITLHIGHKKHQASLHIYEEDAHKIWEHVFISKCAVGTTTGHHGKKGGGGGKGVLLKNMWAHVFISKCAVGTTTVLLAQASIFCKIMRPCY